MVSVPECGFPLSLRGSPPPCHCGERSTPFHCHCGEAVRRGNPSLPLLSLRGAKRRGNPFSFWWQVRNRYVVRGNGLPRQSADWLAMTGGGRCVRWSYAVIAGKLCDVAIRLSPSCHCEERSDVAIRSPFWGRYEIATLQGGTDCRASVRTGSQ